MNSLAKVAGTLFNAASGLADLSDEIAALSFGGTFGEQQVALLEDLRLMQRRFEAVAFATVKDRP